MKTPEESLSQELYFDEDSESVEEQLNPIIVVLKEWFISRDTQSLLACDTKLEPTQWITLCEHVLWHVTDETVALLPVFLASETIQLEFDVFIDNCYGFRTFYMSPIEAISYKISMNEFIQDSYSIPTMLINNVLPFLVQQPMSQKMIDILFVKLCARHNQYFDLSYNFLECLLQSGKVSPGALHAPSYKRGLIAFYENYLNFNSHFENPQYLPLPITYKQEALNNRKQKVLDHQNAWPCYLLFSMSKHVAECVDLPGYQDCMIFIMKTLYQVYEGPRTVGTFFIKHQSLEEKHKNEKKVYANTLIKFWLFSEANVVHKDIKPAIAANMLALHEAECRELSVPKNP